MKSDERIITLKEWQGAVLPCLRNRSFDRSKIANLTLLAYFFWDDERIETEFFAIECAFLCAWKSWGWLPSVLVVNKVTETIKKFAVRYDVKLQLEASLTGGIPAMSIDCIKKLHMRFETEYVVIIQTDGMPVNSGIEHFLEKYDYVGAPWPGHCHKKDWFPYPKYGVGNGGFCLRSKRICEQAAKAYNAFWQYLPYNWLVGDDVFYCKTMPFFSRYWKRNFCFPNRNQAIEFAIEHVVPGVELHEPPIGFHSEIGFREYVKRFGIPFVEYFSVEN